MPEPGLSSLATEMRRFPPPEGWAAGAVATAETYRRAAEDRLAFWAERAGDLQWSRPWDRVLDWSNPPFARWFDGGELNVTVNCVDRHVEAEVPELPKTAAARSCAGCCAMSPTNATSAM